MGWIIETPLFFQQSHQVLLLYIILEVSFSLPVLHRMIHYFETGTIKSQPMLLTNAVEKAVRLLAFLLQRKDKIEKRLPCSFCS